MTSETDPRIEAFFEGAKRWKEELALLRSILLSTPLTEEYKWRGPCYTFQGGNVATIWGLAEAPALSFFKGVLLKDPEGVLVAPGENSHAVRMFKFEGLAEIRKKKALVKRTLLEAIELEKAGLKVKLEPEELDYPEELVARLKKDAKLKKAFEALTPGRRRGYLLHFAQAKQSSTRAARIDRYAPKILAGKGMNDR